MLQIRSDVFKDMVIRCVKGCGNNKLIPITSLLGIKVRSGILTLQSTDATNYLYIRHKIDTEAEDFNVTVPAELFSKLVSKTTSENIVLTQENSVLVVNGNGNYKVELPVDENGDLIKYPDPLSEVKLSEEPETVELDTIRRMITTLKPALAVTLENPCYTGYYVGENVLASDTYKIAELRARLFNKDVLLSAEMVDLLGLMTEEKIAVDFFGNSIAFTSPNCDVYGDTMDGIEEFNVDAINQLINQDIEGTCKIPKDKLINILDRLALFVSPYDDNGINLKFTKENLELSSKASTGVEVISYLNDTEFDEFTCCVDVEMLVSIVKAQACELLEIKYGNNNFIKFIDGDVILLVSLLNNE